MAHETWRIIIHSLMPPSFSRYAIKNVSVILREDTLKSLTEWECDMSEMDICET